MKKKKISNTLIFFSILLVAILNIIYGTVFQVKTIKTKENSIKTTASIHQLTTNKDTMTAYIHYKIKDKEYTGVYLSKDMNLTVNDRITIYCNPNNANQFTDGTINSYGYDIILLGITFILIDLYLFRKKKN